MNKNTIIYGLLIAGGLLAFYAWKKQSLKSVDNSKSGSTSSTSGVFVDDVPVSPSVLGIKSEPTSFVGNLKESVTQIIEPIFATNKKLQSSVQGQFLES